MRILKQAGIASVILCVAWALWIHGRDVKTCTSSSGTYTVGKNTPCGKGKLIDLMYSIQLVVNNEMVKTTSFGKRILSKWDGTINELVDIGNAPAVTTDKQSIRVCLQGDPPLNALIFVVLHELAHIGSASYGHTDEFWHVFSRLLNVAESLHIYDDHDPSERVCGREIGKRPGKI
jgi:hypothetical protein